MNSFYNEEELKNIGLKKYGRNVLISKKASIYKPEMVSIENNVRIDDFCILSGCIKLGSFIHIAAYSALYGGDKGITIEDFANISSRVSIYSINDDYSGNSMTNPMVHENYKNVESRHVHIGRHVIIGSASIVLPGVYLAEGSSFGSFSLIKENFQPWSINAGIPCRKLKERDRKILELEEIMMCEFDLEREFE